MSQLLNENTDENLYRFSITGANGIYDVKWENLQISAHISYMKNHSDGTTKAEVVMVSQRPASPGHLKHGQINLTSPSSRKSWAKLVAERDPSVDWDEIMEQLSVAVLQKWRAGSPVETIDGDADVTLLQRFLVYPLVVRGQANLLYAPGATGKSWVGQWISALVDAGRSDSGLIVSPDTEEKRANVLYLDYETNKHELDARMTLLRRGLGISGPCNIKYRRMHHPLASDIERIKEICHKHSIELVVIDSVGKALGGEPESSAVALTFFSALGTLERTSLCIHHTNKANDSKDSKNIHGSGYIRNEGRNIWEGRQSQKEEESKIVLGLFHKKVNNGKYLKPLGLTINFQHDEKGITRKVVIESQALADTELVEHLSVASRIQAALRRGPLTVGQLGGEVFPDRDPRAASEHVRVELSRREGMFVRLTEGGEVRYANRAYNDDLHQAAKQKFMEEDAESWDLN